MRPARTDFGQSQAARELLGNYEQWLNSSYRAQDVINILQLDMEANALLGDVTVASDRLGLVLQINVENTDPNLGNDIARTWGDLLIQWQNEENNKNRQEDRITIEPQDDPKVVGVSPNVNINTAAGFVFGALLGVIVIFVLEWVESGVVRRAEDVERYLEIPVVGQATAGDELDSVAALKLMAGREIGNSLVYGTVGAAHAKASVGGTDLSDDGLVYGLGFDYALNDRWTVGGEVLQHQFNDFDASGTDFDATTIKAKVGMKF